MINQQTFFQRRRQRHLRQANQLTIPLEQEPASNVHDEQYRTLRALDKPLAQAIQTVRHEVYAITHEHCGTMVRAFQELVHAVQQCMSALESLNLPADMRPYHIRIQLSGWHRILIGAQILVHNVRGQCRYGCLATDPTGSYWHLRTCLHDVVRDYQRLIGQLTQEEQQYTSAIA
jgi:hypothetical protein